MLRNKTIKAMSKVLAATATPTTFTVDDFASSCDLQRSRAAWFTANARWLERREGLLQPTLLGWRFDASMTSRALCAVHAGATTTDEVAATMWAVAIDRVTPSMVRAARRALYRAADRGLLVCWRDGDRVAFAEPGNQPEAERLQVAA